MEYGKGKAVPVQGDFVGLQKDYNPLILTVGTPCMASETLRVVGDTRTPYMASLRCYLALVILL